MTDSGQDGTGEKAPGGSPQPISVGADKFPSHFLQDQEKSLSYSETLDEMIPRMAWYALAMMGWGMTGMEH